MAKRLLNKVEICSVQGLTDTLAIGVTIVATVAMLVVVVVVVVVPLALLLQLFAHVDVCTIFVPARLAKLGAMF